MASTHDSLLIFLRGRELAAYLKGLPIPKTEPEAHPHIQRHLKPKAE
jgi:hypothetical protein